MGGTECSSKYRPPQIIGVEARFEPTAHEISIGKSSILEQLRVSLPKLIISDSTISPTGTPISPLEINMLASIRKRTC